MRITHNEIRRDAENIVKAMALSNREVTSLFVPLKRLLAHILLFFMFVVIDYFLFDSHKYGAMLYWFFSFIFGVVNWMLLLGFIYGYESLFIVINDGKVSEFKLIKLIRRKVKLYAVTWLIAIALLGLMSVFDKLNIDVLVFGNFVVSLLLLLIFNVDMSRYQVSALIGSLSAMRKTI